MDDVFRRSMLFAVFQTGDSSYAVAAAQIIEILPLLHVTPAPGASPGIVGVCNYHGEPVPVVDLCALLTGRAAPALVSTRMLLTAYTSGDEASGVLALIVSGATDTVHLEPSDFAPTGLSIAGREWLGPVALHGNRLLQRIDIEALVSRAMRGALVGGTRGGSA